MYNFNLRILYKFRKKLLWKSKYANNLNPFFEFANVKMTKNRTNCRNIKRCKSNRQNFTNKQQKNYQIIQDYTRSIKFI